MEKDFREIGCIIIPKGISNGVDNDFKSIEDFKSFCFNQERFWIMTNRRGMLSNVPCLHQVLDDIEFPLDDNSFGSQVLVEYLSEYKQYMIVGTLSKVGISTYHSEESLSLSKTYKGNNKNSFGNTVGIIGNTLLSNLSVFCKNVRKKTAKLFIECFGDKESELNLNSSGWILVKGESGIKLRYKTEKEIVILKDKIEVFFSKKQKLTLTEGELFYQDGQNKFKIDKSGYNLGNINFEKYLTEILDFLGNDIMLLTSMGPTSPGCLTSTAGPKLIQLKTKLAKINL